MNEKTFQTELIRGANSLGMHVVRIPDGWAGGVGGGRRPYDIGMAYQGKYVAMELKQIRSGASFTQAHMERHQIIALQNAISNGCGGMVVVNFRMIISDRLRNILSVKKVNRAWAIPIQEVLGYPKIPLVELILDPVGWGYPELIQIHVDKKPAWDPRPIWRGVA